VVALDVIGYNLGSQIPEPATMLPMGRGLVAIGISAGRGPAGGRS